MVQSAVGREPSVEQALLGDEAVAQAALDAGVAAAYAYPGTPSTEILAFLIDRRVHGGGPKAEWTANEKTAYEQALGVSMMGRRVLVAMKHVGLNVAADPFINSALVDIRGGLVVAVADDPGMHSSQNEQDTRVLADFARVACLEPSNPQEAYEMTREAFDVSERFHIPVVVRLVTRVCHGRAAVRRRPPLPLRSPRAAGRKASWVLLPANARRMWGELLAMQTRLASWAEDSCWNRLEQGDAGSDLGVITTGFARSCYLENAPDLRPRPWHLHIGAYPQPMESIRKLAGVVKELLVLEEGQPHLERMIRGVLPTPVAIRGKLDGEVPAFGELTPEAVRKALGLPGREILRVRGFQVPPRPPRLCEGCPHRDVFAALGEVLAERDGAIVMGDIGCYTLGALPPYELIDSCVCMGASIGMAKGAADVGKRPVLAVIGDSTFLHSGVTGLMDAVRVNANVTLLILDNGTVAMTGQQPTVLPSSRLEEIVRATGVAPKHVVAFDLHPRRTPELVAVVRREIAYDGLSVIVGRRECVQSARSRRATP